MGLRYSIGAIAQADRRAAFPAGLPGGRATSPSGDNGDACAAILVGLVDSDTSPIRLTFKQTLFKTMAKAYWISAYRSVRDQDALAAYAKLAGPALQAAGGRFLARGLPARVYEDGLEQRLVLIEFDSVVQAIAAHDSPAYQQALRVLGNAVDRDLRIVGGVE
jgi:uncharacterized protein (DUF1330 family)